MPTAPAMSTKVQFDENATCARCGRFGAFVFEEDKLCADCYEIRGACCPEFGGDDLTAGKEPAADTTGDHTRRGCSGPARPAQP